MYCLSLGGSIILGTVICSAYADIVATPSFLAQLQDAVTQSERIYALRDTDFIFDFMNPNWSVKTTVAKGYDGHTVSANAATMPALMAEDVAMTVGFIGPCGMNTPHTHPRATEFNYVVSGKFMTGMLQENGVRPIMGTVHKGQASLFPRGSIHFEVNLGCEPAVFVAAFSNPDPGVLQVAQGLFGLPSYIVGPVLGNALNPMQIAALDAVIPANVAYGLKSCMKQCKIRPSVINQSTFRKLLQHSHITGYAYGVFVFSLLLLHSIIHQVRKSFRAGDYFRPSPWLRRWVMYAPTITLKKGQNKPDEKSHTRTLLRADNRPKDHAITIELPSNLQSATILLFWFVNAALAVWDIETIKPRREFFQRVGWLATWNLVGLVILAMKSSPLAWMAGKSHDRMILYHKAMAWTAFVEVWIHSIWGMVVIPLNDPDHRFYFRVPQIGAWIATPAFTVLVLTASSAWFVERYFESFLVIHVVGMVTLLVGLYLHNALLMWYVIAIVALWLTDRMGRLARVAWLNRHMTTRLAILTPLPGATQITFKADFKWKAGGHIYINFPSCDPLQSHPYTIATIENDIQLLVQSGDPGGKGFSSRLRRQIEGGVTRRRFIFHGPYGSAPNMVFYERALCIGGGSGITLAMAMTQSFLRAAPLYNRGKVTLVWSAKTLQSFLHFDIDSIKSAGADVRLYHTKKEERKSDAITPSGVVSAMTRTGTILYNALSRRPTANIWEQERTRDFSLLGQEEAKEVIELDNTGEPHDTGATRLLDHSDEEESYEDQSEEALSQVPWARDTDARISHQTDRGELGRSRRPRLTVATNELTNAERREEMLESSAYQRSTAETAVPLVSPAVSMPSFIATPRNRALHREAMICEQARLDGQPISSWVPMFPETTDLTLRNMNELERVDENGRKHLSNGSSSSGIFSDKELSEEEILEKYAPIGRKRAVYDDLVQEFIDSALEGDRLVLIVCGKKEICRLVRNALARARTSLKIDLHVEEF